ncbi:MAG: nucleotide exchange factor GrpE [Marmoricola sp.]
MSEAADRTGQAASDVTEAADQVPEEQPAPSEANPEQEAVPDDVATAPEAEPVAPPPAEGSDELSRARRELAERTLDVQRLQAEFRNYKRRVDRDRDLVRQNAVFVVLTPFLDVLDTIDRAREHGELEGGFKAVAEQLERVVTGLGLTRFGEPGDPFDPTMHEALSHVGTDPDVSVVTCKHVAKAGYKIGDRVVRAAQVLVVDPVEQEQPGEPTEQGDAAPNDQEETGNHD